MLIIQYLMENSICFCCCQQVCHQIHLSVSFGSHDPGHSSVLRAENKFRELHDLQEDQLDPRPIGMTTSVCNS